MSAESKKKRGIAGKANAESSPYRLNGGGLYPRYMREILGSISHQIGRRPSHDRSISGRPMSE